MPVNGPGSNVPWGKSPLFPADPNASAPRPPTIAGDSAVPWHQPEVIEDQSKQ